MVVQKICRGTTMNKWLLIFLAIISLCGICYILDNSPVWYKIIHIKGR